MNMILLYLLFLVICIVFVIFPFWVMWNISMSFSPHKRLVRNEVNRRLMKFILFMAWSSYKILLAFFFAIIFIDILKLVLLPVDQWNGPLSFLPLIKPLFSH